MGRCVSCQEGEKAMKCPECYGDRFDHGRYEVTQMMEGQPVLLTNVRAQRCVQCGYLVVASDVLRDMQRRVANGLSTGNMLIDVYDLQSPTRKSSRGRIGTAAVTTLYATTAHPDLAYETKASA